MVEAEEVHHYRHNTLLHVIVLGQEGDSKQIEVHEHQTCHHFLHAGLHALYGHPGPNPDDYDLVLGGNVIDPLTQTVQAAGIANEATVSVLPKSISRGSH